MAGRWEHYPHGADIGVRGVGRSLEEAFAEAARAMTAAAVDPDAVRAETAVPIRCSGSDAEDLLYAWLNAVIYEMATRRMLFSRFDVTVEGGTLEAVAWGEPVAPERHEPAVEVKGATYTTLHVRRDGEQWIAECVVDV
jgi:SHS2 domain-containing protein